MKIGIISLGCARNLVDSEQILGRLQAKGFEITDIDKAEVAIVNTCSFIKEATEESLDVIFELLELKKKGKLKKVIVAGCLPQRYKDELTASLKGVDAFAGRLSIKEMEPALNFKLTPPHFAYVKISEGCINRCSYCVIPQIKGPLVSRSIDSVVSEVKILDRKGVAEINLIGQDITSYGMDLRQKNALAVLIKAIISQTKNFRWLRLLYANPRRIDRQIIDLIKNEERIVKYIDLPIQHINDRILKEMSRKVTRKQLLNLIRKLRKEIPFLAIRSSLIVGFPGESDKEFKGLLDFVKEVKFERLGVFIYSREEGSLAFKFKSQVPEKIKKERFGIIMKAQQEIAAMVNSGFMGKVMEVLIDAETIDTATARSINAECSHTKKYNKMQEGVDNPPQKKENIYLGRTYADAPEVDGLVYIHARRKHKAGDFVKIKITDTLEYDLVGEEL